MDGATCPFFLALFGFYRKKGFLNATKKVGKIPQKRFFLELPS